MCTFLVSACCVHVIWLQLQQASIQTAHVETNVWSLAWLPDSTLFVSSGGDFFIKVWQSSGGQGSSDSTTTTSKTNAGGMSLAVAFPRTHTDNVFAVTAGSDGTVFAGSADSTATRWDPKNPDKALATYSGHTKDIRSLAVDPDVVWLFTASTDCTARQFNVKTATCVRVFMHVAGIIIVCVCVCVCVCLQIRALAPIL